MKKLLFLALFLPALASAQILKTPGLPHYGNPPLDPPTSKGSEIAVDTTNRIWQWDRQDAAWRKLGYTLQQTVGCVTPAYTPGRTESPFAVDGCSPTPRIWFYLSGTWVQLNAGAVTSVNGATGAVVLDLARSGNTLSLTGDGSAVDLSGYLDNTDAQTLSLNTNTLAISGGNSVSLAGYMDNTDSQTLDTFAIVSNVLRASVSGDGVPFKSVSLAPYLDNTDAQNLSLSGQTLSITGGASATLPVVGITAGTGINATPTAGNYTITNTGDTDPSNDVTTSSTAGGDLSGTFSNLQIAANAVGNTEMADNAIANAELADDAVHTAEIQNAAVTMAKIAQASATTDQVIKWNGSAWAPADDETGGGGGGGVSTVTGDAVDNTDPDNPVVNAIPLDATGLDVVATAANLVWKTTTDGFESGVEWDGFMNTNPLSGSFGQTYPYGGSFCWYGGTVAGGVRSFFQSNGEETYFEFGGLEISSGNKASLTTNTNSVTIKTWESGSAAIEFRVTGSEFYVVDSRATKTGLTYAGDYSADISTNARSLPDVGTVNLLKQTPVSYSNAAAPNNCIFYSTTDSKLSYKDPAGTVHPLY